MLLCLCFGLTLRMLFFAQDANAAKRKVVPSPIPQRLTTLRTGSLSILLASRGKESGTRLLSARITNVGDVEARDISVYAEAEKGLVIPLRGPKRLPAHSIGVYVTTFRLPTGVSLKSHASAVCSTCRR